MLLILNKSCNGVLMYYFDIPDLFITRFIYNFTKISKDINDSQSEKNNVHNSLSK